MRKLYRDDLLERVEAFRAFYQANVARIRQLSVQVSYVTRAEVIHPALDAQVTTLVDACRRLFPGAPVAFEFIGAQKLLDLIRTPRPEWVELRLHEGPLVAGENGFIALVRLADYAQFISDETGLRRRAMFLDNVRDYEGAHGVNLAIARTLHEGQGEDFWTLNNGVTILADEVRTAYKVIVLRNPKVVNGLQTSMEIFKRAQDATDQAWSDDRRAVLVRVVVPKSEDSRDRIIVATNSQTPIAQGVLKATDGIHRDIEDTFRRAGLFYERRRNAYRNEGVAPDLIVTMPSLASAVTAIYLRRPHLAVKVNFAKRALATPSLYEEVFSNEYALGMYVTCWRIAAHVQQRLTLLDVPDDEEDMNEVYRRRGKLWWSQWHIAMSVAMRAARTVQPTTEVLAGLSEDAWAQVDLTEVAQDVSRVIVDVRQRVRRTRYQAAKTPLSTEGIITVNEGWITGQGAVTNEKGSPKGGEDSSSSTRAHEIN